MQYRSSGDPVFMFQAFGTLDLMRPGSCATAASVWTEEKG
jgi:hypothetical protein